MSWPQVRLADCCEIVSGATPKTSVDEYWGGPIAWATPKDLSNLEGKHLDATPQTLTDAGYQSCSAKLMPKGSVLFSSRAPIGHVAINTVPICTNQGFKSFIPDSEQLSSDYLFYWLRANKPYLQSLGNGATFKEVSKAIVAEVKIPLPPLPEQRRIAAILDKADALRAKRREAMAKCDQLLQSVFLDMFGDPVTNPKGWPTIELAEAVNPGTIVTYGIVQAGDEVDGGIPYVRTGDIVNGKIQENSLRHTSPEIAAKFQRSRVEAGDIIMSIRATVGTTAVVTESLHGANLTQGTARIAAGAMMDTDYLLNHLRSHGTQVWIQRQIKGATFREITLKRLRELPVMDVPRDLQGRFAAIAHQLRCQASTMEASLLKLREEFASLQQRAFSGQLSQAA
ncbi:restriction modification system DNA specificity domain-containing protein [Oceanococcus atlanticus]|uniref:Restriction modification system DNA specificity domain-containing protein n=1 Tax=Oceanococcus atlanticus TaxID=1317117 RepID=A0A1Y1SHU4_9GAMM|nr:restriction endonuclease subunit S [Oceanococcus atlanticus]ORE88769.1 restriction modification system DNA specificity domain-containing protein [Oceanococcus atlanticus]